jgi:hypothetical protein
MFMPAACSWNHIDRRGRRSGRKGKKDKEKTYSLTEPNISTD